MMNVDERDRIVFPFLFFFYHSAAFGLLAGIYSCHVSFVLCRCGLDAVGELLHHLRCHLLHEWLTLARMCTMYVVRCTLYVHIASSAKMWISICGCSRRK